MKILKTFFYPQPALILIKYFQNLALQLSQRLNQLTETNERLCESKQGSNFTAYYAGKATNKSCKYPSTFILAQAQNLTFDLDYISFLMKNG